MQLDGLVPSRIELPVDQALPKRYAKTFTPDSA
jgi:hypothetical protein